MEADRGKLFIGGIAWDTTVEKLRDYFGRYGEVLNAKIVKDNNTGLSRGFGFVSYSDASVVDRVLQEKHFVGDRMVEVKQALLREENEKLDKIGNGDVGETGSAGMIGKFRTKKIFVGGLPADLTEEKFRQYFGSYGGLIDVVIMRDRDTGRPRGFGFVSFEEEDSVDRVLSNTFHELNGKLVEVKRAQPKEWFAGSGRSGDVHGHGVQLYSPRGLNVNGDSGQIVNNNFLHFQSTSNGFHPYHYATPHYGYYGFGGYAVCQYGFVNPMGAYQPPFAPVGYATTSHGPVPVLTSQFPNGIGYGNKGTGYSNYYRDGISPFNGLCDDRVQSRNVSNTNGGGGDPGKDDINHDNLTPKNSQDAGHKMNGARQTSAKDSNLQ